jgi:hypothetical protein
MTAKEKAKELFDKYVELSGIFVGDYESEKEMCLIAVNEVLYVLNEIDSSEQWNASYFYNQVKQEIENL